MSRLGTRLAKLEGPNEGGIVWVYVPGDEYDETALRKVAVEKFGETFTHFTVWPQQEVTEPQFEFIEDMDAVLANASKNSTRIGSGVGGNG